MINRQVLLSQRVRPPKARSVPAPIDGWNARDSLADMKETDAVQLDNWYPGLGKVDLRKGFISHSTGLGGAVETLAEYQSGSAQKLIAAADGKIWDASSASPSSLVTGLTNDRWQTANFDAKMGLVNGADDPKVYDGSTVSNMTISGSGLTTTSVVGIAVFKTRTFFWTVNSQDFWYSAVNTLGGALTKFPLSRVGTFGGSLTTIATWTRDGGSGVDDLAVFVMSSGEVIIYAGTDPGDAASWALVGVFRIGAPLGRRCTAKFGGDLLVMTLDGYVSLSAVLAGGRESRRAVISDKIDNAVLEQASMMSGDFGWQALQYPVGGFFLFNVPNASAEFDQHILNTNTGAWCRFRGMNGAAWSLFQDDLYFGGQNGTVYKAWNGTTDDGADIVAVARTAFNYLGSRARRKRVSAVQLYLAVDGEAPISVALDADFEEKVRPFETSVVGTGGGAAWDVAEWDVAEWAGSGGLVKKTILTQATGYSVNFQLETHTQDQTLGWYSQTYIFQDAGVI